MILKDLNDYKDSYHFPKVPTIPSNPIQTTACEFSGLQIKKDALISGHSTYPQAGDKCGENSWSEDEKF